MSAAPEPSLNVETRAVARSIEYAHLYADETVGVEHQMATRMAGMTELGQNPLPHRFGQVDDAAHAYVVLVDDYNVRKQITRADARVLADQLALAGRRPDYVFCENSFAGQALTLLDELEQGRLRKSLIRYLDKHRKIPCSLMTAAWYLTRLGVFESPQDRLSRSQAPPAERLVNVLPLIYEETENKVAGILKASPWADVLPYIDYEWIETFKPWEHMRASSYFEDNYQEPLPCDIHLARLLKEVWKRIGPIEQAVELGTGANLMPVLAALPYVSTQLLVTDYSAANRQWLKTALDKIDPDWMRYPATDRNQGELQMRAVVVARVEDLDIFYLPNQVWDAASMHFVAESITDSRTRFHMALSSIHDSLKPGGHLLASFMIGSTGWDVAGAHFPAVPLTIDDVLTALDRNGFAIHRTQTLNEGDEPVRDGYDTMLFVHART